MKKLLVYLAVPFLVMAVALNASAGKKLKLGIINLVKDHPDHKLLSETFVKEMQKKGYDVEAVYFDANSAKYPVEYTRRAADEAKRMETSGFEMIFCTATYHGVVNAGVKIPVIDAVSISPYELNLAIKKGDKGFMKTNATGIVFGYPFKDIIKLMKVLNPKAKKIAYLYNPQSPISRPLPEFSGEAKKAGLTVVACPFGSKAEILQAVKKAQKETEMGFATNDLAVLGGEKEGIDLAVSINYPLIVGVVPMVDIGAAAAIQYDWTRSAKMCAEKAEKILKGTSANTIPIEFADSVEIGINLKNIKKMGLAVPYEWVDAASKVIE